MTLPILPIPDIRKIWLQRGKNLSFRCGNLTNSSFLQRKANSLAYGHYSNAIIDNFMWILIIILELWVKKTTHMYIDPVMLLACYFQNGGNTEMISRDINSYSSNWLLLNANYQSILCPRYFSNERHTHTHKYCKRIGAKAI